MNNDFQLTGPSAPGLASYKRILCKRTQQKTPSHSAEKAFFYFHEFKYEYKDLSKISMDPGTE
ncbi:hypothetical protein CEF21_14960 [Bacillus sp. FJAT-42376]|nr:hypothetical protein CEF21_14960 [Bacillus sp. FJAT-42376]